MDGRRVLGAISGRSRRRRALGSRPAPHLRRCAAQTTGRCGSTITARSMSMSLWARDVGSSIDTRERRKGTQEGEGQLPRRRGRHRGTCTPLRLLCLSTASERWFGSAAGTFFVNSMHSTHLGQRGRPLHAPAACERPTLCTRRSQQTSSGEARVGVAASRGVHARAGMRRLVACAQPHGITHGTLEVCISLICTVSL